MCISVGVGGKGPSLRKWGQPLCLEADLKLDRARWATLSEEMRGDSQEFSLRLLPRSLGWPHWAAETGRYDTQERNPGFVSSSSTTCCTIQTGPFAPLGCCDEDTCHYYLPGGADRRPAPLFSPTALSWLQILGPPFWQPHSFSQSFIQQMFRITSGARLCARPGKRTDHT